MLDSLKQAGKHIGRELGRAWENLSEGWRELLSRGGDSLTHFSHAKPAAAAGGEPEEREAAGGERLAAPGNFPRWSLLAGEVEETANAIVVRIEAPGMEKEDCRISIEGNMLYVSGEKRFERETHDSTYHVMERAYGAFQRAISLPGNVDIEQANASYKNGVLSVRLPKTGGGATARNIPVS